MAEQRMLVILLNPVPVLHTERRRQGLPVAAGFHTPWASLLSMTSSILSQKAFTGSIIASLLEQEAMTLISVLSSSEDRRRRSFPFTTSDHDVGRTQSLRFLPKLTLSYS